MLLAAALLLAPAVTQAQPVEQKLMASDGTDYDRFGSCISVSGDLALVCASDSVYVFRRVGEAWVEEQKLTASGSGENDYFGASAALWSNLAFVGAPYDDDKGTNSGAVYVFRREGNAWVEVQKLTASDGNNYDFFGRAVSVSGDVALIGAYGDNVQGASSGSAYVFRRVEGTWVQERKLTASDGSAEDFFGYSVSIVGDVAVVGAYGEDGGTFFSRDRGAAYVFRRVEGIWEEERKLFTSDGCCGERFGFSVAIMGDITLVGAARDDVWRGSVYAYRYTGTSWLEEQKLPAPNSDNGDEFGFSISLRSGLALIGAPGTNYTRGAAYLFRRVEGTWVQEEEMTASDGAMDDFFGTSVSLSGNVAFIGAPYDDENAYDGGAAYVYDLSTSVATEPETTPTAFVLHPPAPNPATDRATVAFALNAPSEARLTLHDVLGREVATVAERRAPGQHQLVLDVSKLPAGVYVWRLSAGERAEAGRLTVVR